MNTIIGRSSDQAAAAPLPDTTNTTSRILLVEDDQCIRQFYVRILVRAGHRVDTAEDGAAGWEALQVNRYDLLITDHDMPKVTGVELVKKLRAARMALPVILASGAMPTEELARHPWLQFAAMLEKPIASEVLLNTVQEVLRAPSMQAADHVAATLTERVTYGQINGWQTGMHSTDLAGHPLGRYLTMNTPPTTSKTPLEV